MKPTRRLFAFLLVLAMLLTDSGMTALAEAVLTMPAALQIIDEEAFYGDTSIGKVVLSENVTEIRARAFANSTLSEINLPDSLTFIDESAFDGPDKVRVTATKGTYAYEWAVANGYISNANFQITSIARSAVESTVQINRTILWSVKTQDAVGVITYSYYLMRNGTLEDSVENVSRNYYMKTMNKAGVYVLRVNAIDSDGNSTEAQSEELTVLGEDTVFQISDVSLDAQSIVSGDTISASVSVKNASGAVQYTFDLLPSGQSDPVETTTSSNAEYTKSISDSGTYSIRVTATDSTGAKYVYNSSSFTVVALNVAAPVAPTIDTSDVQIVLSSTESGAVENNPEQLVITWDHVEYAHSYHVTLARKNGSTWVQLQDETITVPGYSFSKSLFESVTGKTIFRIGLSSVNEREGSVRYYYFAMLPKTINTALTVNSKTSITWNQRAAFGSQREFQVSSELPWNASANVDWIKCSVDAEKLVLTLEENPMVLQNRTGIVSVSNGENTVKITATQGTDRSALTISYPSWSTEESSPTSVPVGGVYFELESNNKGLIRVFEKNSNGSYAQAFELYPSSGRISLAQTTNGYTLKANTTYKIVVLGAYSSAYKTNEVEADMLQSAYFIRLTNSGHSIAVNGTTAYADEIEDSLTVKVNATNLFTCSSNASWLTLNRTQSTTQNQSITFTATPNYTNAARTAVVTFTCGSASAKATITQKSMKPSVLIPSNLSTSEGSPTTLPYQDMYLEFQCAAWDFALYSNGTYTSIEGISSGDPNGAFETTTGTMDKERLVDGGKYRITVSAGTQTVNYYVLISGTGSEDTLTVSGDAKEVSSWNAIAESRSLSVKASAAWTASTNVSWLTLSSTSGAKGTTSLTVSSKANTTGSMRTGRIVFKIGSREFRAITITQAATDYVSLVDRDTGDAYDASLHYNLEPGKKHSVKVTVYCGGNWSASTNDSWLTVKTSGTLLTITLAANSTGASRTGTVTVQSGNYTKTVSVTQVPPLDTPSITYPTISTDYTNPSIMSYQDITVKWDAVAGAAKYTVELFNTENMYERTVTESGQANYSCTIPKAWLKLGADGYHYIMINAYDQYGYYTYKEYEFVVSSGDAAVIRGTTTPVWDNATDYTVSQSFVVQASATWNATAQQSWITISPQSGSNGSELKVTLAQNNGAARTGKVAIKVNSTTIYLTINQCAALKDAPVLLTPTYSNKKAEPTLISSGLSSIKATWEVEPQALYYFVDLMEYETPTISHVVASSGNLRDGKGEYTFKSLSLVPGQLYWIKLVRGVESGQGRGNVAVNAYFIIDNNSSWVKIDGDNSIEYEEDSLGGYISYNITGSGVWAATSSAEWITVGRKYIDQDYLDEHEDTNSEHMAHIGAAGDDLYIVVYPNTTNRTRTGSITVKCGTATGTINVMQRKGYTLASLTSHSFASSPSEATDLKYGDIYLQWSASVGGTGKYIVYLYEAATKTSSFKKIYSIEDLSGRTAVIPADKMTEGKYYRIFLGSEIDEGDDDYFGNNYYFRLASKNELTLSSSVDWSKAGIGGMVCIRPAATGGDGTYKYAYELLKGDEQINITTWMKDGYYTFPITTSGTYKVRTYVIDGYGTQKQVMSDPYTVSKQADTLSISQTSLAFDADGGSETISVTASGSWSYTKSGTWVTVTKGTDTLSISVPAYTSTTDRSGSVTVTCGEKSLTINVYQLGKPAGSSATLSISDSVWNITSTEAASITITVNANNAWSISGKPDWMTIAPTSGEGNSKVVLYATANMSFGRWTDLTFSSGGITRTLRVTQTGTELSASVSGFTVSNSSPYTGEEVTFEISTQNADEVEFLVDGKSWDNRISVINNHATFHRSFSAGGTRTIQFVPYRNGGMGIISESQAMTVQYIGKLPVPVIHQPADIKVGNSVVLEWNQVENAEKYTIALYNGNSVTTIADRQDENSVLIPASMLTETGTYVATVIAVGKGYTQSESSISFDVVQPSKVFSITAPAAGSYVVTDSITLTANNPDKSNLVFRVEHDGDVSYYPETGTLHDATIAQNMPWSTLGDYVITLLAFPTEERWNESLAWASESRTIKLNGPILYEKYVGSQKIALENNPTYRVLFADAVTSITAVYNNAAILAELTKDGGAPETMDGPNSVQGNEWMYSFTLSTAAPIEGKHEYVVNAMDDALNSGRAIFRFYAITRVSDSTKYPQSSVVQLKQYPDANATVLHDLYPSDAVTLKGQCGNYWYVEHDGTRGFVLKPQIGDSRITTWDGLSLTLTENSNKSVYYISDDVTLDFTWTSSVTLPKSAQYSLVLENTITGKQTSAYVGNDTKATVKTSLFGEGSYRAVLKVILPHSITVYATATGTKTYRMSSDISIYLEDYDKDLYQSDKELIERAYYILCDYNSVFADGWKQSNGTVLKADLSKLIDNWLLKAYQGAFGDTVTATGLMWRAYVAESIMMGVSTYNGNNVFKMPLGDMKKLLKIMGMTENVMNDILYGQMCIEWMDDDDVTWTVEELNILFKNQYEFKLGDAFKGVKEGVDMAKIVQEAMKKYMYYRSYDKTKLAQIKRALELSGNEDMIQIKKILDMLSDDTQRIYYLAASYGLSEGTKIGVDAVKKAIGGAMPKAWACTIKVCTAFNDLVLNVDNIQKTAARCEWHIRAAQSYQSVMDRKFREFMYGTGAVDFKDFEKCCKTFEYLVQLEYEEYAKFLQEGGGAAAVDTYNSIGKQAGTFMDYSLTTFWNDFGAIIK